MRRKALRPSDPRRCCRPQVACTLQLGLVVGLVLLDPLARQPAPGLTDPQPLRGLNTSAATTSPTKMVFSSLSSDPVMRHST